MSQENTSSYGRSLSIVWRSYLSFYPEEIGTNKIDLRHIVSYKKKIFIIYKYLLQCPDDCTCLHDSAWKHNVITCSHRSENISRQFWENIFRCSVVRMIYPCYWWSYQESCHVTAITITNHIFSMVFLYKICINVEQQLKLGEILKWVLCSIPSRYSL